MSVSGALSPKLWLPALVLVALALPLRLAHAQASDPPPGPNPEATRPPETDSWDWERISDGKNAFFVAEPFDEFIRNHGGYGVVGYPFTRFFLNPHTGRWTQGFTNFMLEYHEGNPEGREIVPMPLVERFGDVTPSMFAKPATGGDCIYVPPGRQNVCYEFGRYFAATGMTGLHGLPLTSFRLEDGTMVQHFENSTLIYAPDHTGPFKIIPEPWGEVAFYLMGLDPALRLPDGDFVPGGDALPEVGPRESYINDLVVRASVSNSLYEADTAQPIRVAVSVHRQVNGQYAPVADAFVRIRILYPEGEARLLLGQTGSDGSLRYDLAPPQPGTVANGTLVNFEVTAYSGKHLGEYTDFFLFWFPNN